MKHAYQNLEHTWLCGSRTIWSNDAIVFESPQASNIYKLSLWVDGQLLTANSAGTWFIQAAPNMTCAMATARGMW